MFRFTIRDVLWLTVLAAVLVAWWIDRSQLAIPAAPQIPFDSWQSRYQKPLIFAQVFFDSAYLLNYKTVKSAIATGTLDGFEVLREKDRKTSKMTNRLPLARARYFADVPFPDKSEAKFMVVGGASVAPYIQYQGEPAANLNLSLLRDAIREG